MVKRWFSNQDDSLFLFEKQFPSEIDRIEKEMNELMDAYRFPLPKDILDRVMLLRDNIAYIRLLKSRLRYG